MTFGRPSTINSGPFDRVPLPKMIDDEFLDTQTQPSATRPDGGITIIAFFVKSLELFNIANDIQNEAYWQQRGVRDGEVNHLISVLKLDNRLVQWAQTLPVHLHYSKCIQEDESLVFRRQRVVLRAR
jgi:predicted CoA-binding protein